MGFFFAGSTGGDEMCNLYLMYYTEAGKASTVNRNCMDDTSTSISKGLPEDSDKALPPNPMLEEMAKHKVWESEWALD